jgi:16S rRNA (adenine1518-N6/adenine1519-N6)-dimethyltransferase
MKHHPKKSLGQHFLTDKNTIAKIVNAIDPKKQDAILEIGPGQGALTYALIRSGCQLTAMELDSALAAEWIKTAHNIDSFQCIEGNAIDIDWMPFLPVDKCIGNIPYNISRPLLYKIFQYRHRIGESILMVQKEFAEKLTASPGEDAYGILSVLSRSFAVVEYLFTIPPTVFFPPPKDMSACVRLKFNRLKIDDALFIDLVQTAFNQRRKTLRNSLKKYYTPDLESKFDWSKRADEIYPEDFIDLIKITP